MRALLVVFASSLIATPALAAADVGASNEGQAESRAPSRTIELGVRSGYALAQGSGPRSSGSFAAKYAGLVPLVIDVGYRVSPRWYVGAFGQYGFLVRSSASPCPVASDCSDYDVRFGVDAQLHPQPTGGPFDPWFGLGAGYELVHDAVNGRSSTTGGFELVNAAAGADVVLDRRFRVGPMLAASVARFTYDGGDERGAPVHAWVSLGARGAFDL